MAIKDLPKSTRKIIFWVVIILITLGLLVNFALATKERLKQARGEKVKEELGIPALQEQWEGMSQIEVPVIDEEALKELEELLRQAEEEQKKQGETPAE
jgi:hypothetical protein